MNEQSIRYALAKQVPAMECGFTISTVYGDITIPAGKLATQLRGHMQRALARELVRQMTQPKAAAPFAPLSDAQAREVFDAMFGGACQ